MHAVIESHRPQIAELCRRFHVRRLEAFGSIVRDDFDAASSDVDFVVEFEDMHGAGLRRYFDLKSQLERLLGRPVDMVELKAMPESRLKRIIQRAKVPVYAAAA